MPLYLPMLADDESVGGLVALLSQRVDDYTSGTRVEREPDPQHIELIEPARAALIEAIIAESEDETLMDRYLAGEDVELSTLIEDLEKAVARGSFYPVIPVAASNGMGLTELLEVVTRGFPSPLEHTVPPVSTPDGKPQGPLSADPNGPLVAEVVKTVSDPYVGRTRWCESSRELCVRTALCMFRGTDLPTADMRTTTSTRRSERSRPH